MRALAAACLRSHPHPTLLGLPLPQRPPPVAGLGALWKGIVPRLARTPPGQAIVWAVSDQITGALERRRREEAARV